MLFRGRDLLALPERSLRKVRGGEIGFVFQDPMSSLNPGMTVAQQIVEPLRIHLGLDRRAARARARELLDLVRIPNAAGRLDRYPHEFSGGQRQRGMIAIGLACRPKLLIADEATTALDVTVQAEIIALVQELKRELGMAIIWITHDLGVVAGISDTVQVMYAGRILERGPVDDIFGDPRNAYTLELLRSLPDLSRGRTGRRRLHQIDGSPPDMRCPPQGDPFAPRNAFATPRCRAEMPPLLQGGGRRARPSRGRLVRPAGPPRRGGCPMSASPAPILSVRNLSKTYPLRAWWGGKSSVFRAVRDVSFDIAPGETLGLVGESGSGKCPTRSRNGPALPPLNPRFRRRGSPATSSRPRPATGSPRNAESPVRMPRRIGGRQARWDFATGPERAVGLLAAIEFLPRGIYAVTHGRVRPTIRDRLVRRPR
ncbi:Vitamin B12 import ATP-binding protein BtuD [Methylobacterium trifolii]|uniref:Vitamin B12 import ATP-binding protein BtuD n=1 Tax=Methylobacterium trifolii TaxID=1003092 RepID=A0ABQ4TY77_9HYPH|nr:oligopeptide/dipeptide ABC transporter ATP-binding protein [Methylobacterium trifolii]GJE59002.1 Vitamin B12 import ATP-binding protein BtuD [Methylobacterium trifolii]